MKQSAVQEKHIKNLNWAFWLSRVNLDDLRDGDWINLREDLNQFVYGTKQPHILRKQHPGGPLKFTSIHVLDKKHFEDIQSSIKGKLLELANQSRYPLDYITSVTEGCDFVVSASSPSEPFSPTIWIDSKTPETPALIALWLHLAGAGVVPERIRVCALQDCKNLYLVNRKPRKDKENFYCSTRCARNAATRQWREIHKDEIRVKERKRSGPRYEAKIKKKFGANTKIIRRPRKARGG